jgi:hypothetical protein
MLSTSGEVLSFAFFFAAVVVLYYNLYLAGLKMEQIDALF